MIDVTTLRNGMFYQENGSPFKVQSYEHTKVGRGGATIKVKVRNLITGAIVQQTFQSGRKLEEADIRQEDGKYLFRTQSDYVFETEDDEIEIPVDQLQNDGLYLKKNLEIQIIFYNNKPIGITLPIKVTYKVKEAPPDARGNSANAATKEVMLENNIKARTPMFIKEGDSVVIDTRTGEYYSRA